jgi:RHS repeat-associated protein
VEELVNGDVQKTYVLGSMRASQEQIASGHWAVSFYGYDGHGSVRQLTDSSGAVTDTFAYDAFGILLKRAGATSTDYLYGGEQFDAHLMFYYLRARYMNPTCGRFATADTFEGVVSNSKTLHRYVYASLNPINRKDPSGYTSIATESEALNENAQLDKLVAEEAAAVISAKLKVLALLGSLLIGVAVTATAISQSSDEAAADATPEANIEPSTPTDEQIDQKVVIYRELWYGYRAKSVALRREIDWRSGLSFSTIHPTAKESVAFKVTTLMAAGYNVLFDGDGPVLDVVDGGPLKGYDGKTHHSHHVTIWHSDAVTWRKTFEEDQRGSSSGNVSAQTQSLWDLREKN